MADDPTNRGPGDRARINVNQRHEVTYWTDAFDCTEAELRAAVARVGVMADDVKAELVRVKKRP